MKQILQSLKTGVTEAVQVPCPTLSGGQLLVRSSRTLVSAGTERMLVDFGKAGLIGKARQQPERVKQVLAKIKSDGLAPTLEAVFNKLDQPLPLGYCNVGRVIQVGADVPGFQAGERIVSNGRHAEVVAVPVNLCARVPDGVLDDEAAFTVLGAIALQGIRLVAPSLGEGVVVTGLGLIGLLAVQLLKAHGCRVLAVDFDAVRLNLAKQFGACTVNLAAGEDPIAAAEKFSRGRGVDAVIITASTKSSEPVHQAAVMCRKRGRIVLVGVTGLSLSRADFYEKEITFQVSCSYGPGRYDPKYEEKGQDYPIGFVRWTEQRNFEAVLDMLADGRLDVKPLVSQSFDLDEADKAYALLSGPEPSLGILLKYSSSSEVPAEALTRSSIVLNPAGVSTGKVAVGFIGSGNYATSLLIPAFKATGARLISVASNAGVSGLHAGRKFGFEKTTTDVSTVFTDDDINSVVVATRHDSHADLVCRGIDARKHVFVEKPLALSLDDVDRIARSFEAATSSGFTPIVTVGFNRRFAPQVCKIKSLLDGVPATKAFVLTVNAGAISAEHWTRDQSIGGGRIAGEACHFIDLLRFLAGSQIVHHTTTGMDSASHDTATIQLRFSDGSIGTVHYFSNGSREVSKERLEVFAGGRVLQLDNFRKLTGHGWPGFRRMNLWRQDKGQKACAAAFVRAVEHGGASPIPFEELLEVSKVTIAVAEAARG